MNKTVRSELAKRVAYEWTAIEHSSIASDGFYADYIAV